MKCFGSFGRRNYWAMPIFRTRCPSNLYFDWAPSRGEIQNYPNGQCIQVLHQRRPTPRLGNWHAARRRRNDELCHIDIFIASEEKWERPCTKTTKEKAFSDYIGATAEAL